MRWFRGLFRPKVAPSLCRDCRTPLVICPAGPHPIDVSPLCQRCHRGLVCPTHDRWWIRP